MANEISLQGNRVSLHIEILQFERFVTRPQSIDLQRVLRAATF